VPPSRRGVAKLARDDRKAWEHLEAEHAGEEYMANLRPLNPEWVAEEAAPTTSTTRRPMYERRREGWTMTAPTSTQMATMPGI
jgi:hypothetical protein